LATAVVALITLAAVLLLAVQCDDLDDDLLEDLEDDLPVWEHEKRVKALPFTGE
jgi:hypothetical protein